MIFRLDNIWATLVQYSPEERRWIDLYTSTESNGYRRGKWGRLSADDRVYMLDPITGRLPAGFMPLILKNAPKDGHVVEVEDLRGDPPCPVDDMADLAWLRGYQEEAVWSAAEASRGLIKVPTAGGKTEIFIGLTRALPCEWLFLVHRGDLVGQAARRFEKRTGERAGTFEGGRWQKGSANITVSTFQALWRAMKRNDFDVRRLQACIQAINVDEVHAQPAETFYKAAMSLPAAYYRIGQSGTPLDRSDQDSLRTIGCIGPMVYKIRTDTLTEAGVLSRPEIYMVPCKQPGVTDCDWRTVYDQLIVHSSQRNDLVAEMAKRAEKPCLLFVDETAHADNIKARLERDGLRVDFVHGGHSLDWRQNAIRALVETRLDVLICTVIFQEGIDVPELESVVVAGGKASIVGALQRIGRGMRTAKGKTGFQVWDVHDRGQKWLSEHANERLKAYRKEGHTVTLGWPAVSGT